MKKMVFLFSVPLAFYWFLVVMMVNAPLDWELANQREILVITFSLTVVVTAVGFPATYTKIPHITVFVLSLASLMWAILSVILLYGQLTCEDPDPLPHGFIILCTDLKYGCTGPVLLITAIVCLYSAARFRSSSHSQTER